MQFDRLSRRLEGISDASIKGYPIRNLYRLMYMPEIWYEAYANIYSNDGAITKGVNEDTLDGFSKERVERIIMALQEEKYRFTPVRRVYIPKRTDNRKRPLGLPTGTDKLMQEVSSIILKRIYEPIFSGNSHGFRPGRSGHVQMLTELDELTFKPTVSVLLAVCSSRQICTKLPSSGSLGLLRFEGMT